LRESEDIVDEQKHILAFFVTEVFCDGETGKGDPSTGAGGFIHLSEYQCCFGLAVKFNDSRLYHFMV
jgi:hypothetical protein